MFREMSGALFTVIMLVVAFTVIEGNGLLGTNTLTISNLTFLSESNTTLTLLENPTLENTSFIELINVTMTDQYENEFPLSTKLVFVTQGEDEGEAWTEWSYALVRWGVGAGDFGDTVAFLQIWDATNITERGYIVYEFSRSSWGKFTVQVSDGLTWETVWILPSLFPTYTPPAQGFVEGIWYSNGTHVP